MKKIWYKWPEHYYNKPWLPWYLIIRRVTTLPLLLLGFGIMYGAFLLGVGVDEAERFRKDL